MDNIKKKIEEVVKKVKEDKDFAKKFKSNPIKAVEDLLGIDLPDDKINNIVEGVQAKLTLDNAGDLFSKAKGLFK
jgi:hypothetical protein